MSTAIVGVGNIGKAVATNLVAGGEPVVLAARSLDGPRGLADDLGPLAAAATVAEAIDEADAVVFAVWLDAIRDLVNEYEGRLDGKVIIDPSNAVAADATGNYARTLPEGVSSASQIVELLPPGAHYAKAFGTLGADSLAGSAHRAPERVALFYATDDGKAEAVVRRLITAAGFEPVKAGGVDDATRIEMFGDLHQYGGLNGQLLTGDQARAALSALRTER
jgi:8-hydroxy-5-deazaflavin:NADPH oxidoreductase